MNLLELLIKKKLKEASTNNNCDHNWISVFYLFGCSVMCTECGDVLFKDLSKKQADSLAKLANENNVKTTETKI